MMFRAFFYVVVIAVGAWVGSMAIDRDPPWQYLNEGQGSSITPDPTVQQGVVSTHWLLTGGDKDCPRTVERIYYNRDTEEFITSQDATPLTRVNPQKGKLSRSFQLPPGLPPRTGYRAKACFQCNLLQHIWPVCTLSPELPINVVN